MKLSPSGATKSERGNNIRDKPAWATLLISVGIACAALTLLTLMVVVTQKLIASRSAGAGGSLAPHAGDASEELEEGVGPVSAGVVSELDGEHILDDLGQPYSFETIPLGDFIFPALNFEETDNGVELG
jgi:hypothetical protein